MYPCRTIWLRWRTEGGYLPFRADALLADLGISSMQIDDPGAASTTNGRNCPTCGLISATASPLPLSSRSRPQVLDRRSSELGLVSSAVSAVRLPGERKHTTFKESRRPLEGSDARPARLPSRLPTPVVLLSPLISDAYDRQGGLADDIDSGQPAADEVATGDR
jgi:hypothetical protein